MAACFGIERSAVDKRARTVESRPILIVGTLSGWTDTMLHGCIVARKIRVTLGSGHVPAGDKAATVLLVIATRLTGYGRVRLYSEP